MGCGVDRRKIAEWQERLARYERTGLKAAEFCRREQVSASVFRYWQQQVERADRINGGQQRQRGHMSPFAAVEIIPWRSVFVRFPGGTSLEIPDDRVDLVRLAVDRLLAGETDYEPLGPDVWKLTHPEAVRQYRVEERISRADAKAEKRARRRAART